MMKSLSLEEENIIKNMRNLFRLKKELNYTEIKDIIFFFLDQKKKLKQLKVLEILRIYNEDCYKPVINNFRSNSYIEYKSKGDRNPHYQVEEYLNEVKPYLKDIINDLKVSDTWKIHLAIRINFICSKDHNDEERERQSKNDNIETMMNGEAEEVIEKLFESLKKIYQNKLEESVKGSKFHR